MFTIDNYVTIRKILGISAEDVAKEIGVTRQYVTNLENGYVKSSNGVFRKAYELTMNELIRKNKFLLTLCLQRILDELEDL